MIYSIKILDLWNIYSTEIYVSILSTCVKRPKVDFVPGVDLQSDLSAACGVHLAVCAVDDEKCILPQDSIDIEADPLILTITDGAVILRQHAESYPPDSRPGHHEDP